MAFDVLKRRVSAAVRAFRDVTFDPPRSTTDVLRQLGAALSDDAVAIDVGANVGAWARAYFDARPRGTVVMIEAQEELLPRLHQIATGRASSIAVNAVLDSAAAQRTFYVCHGDSHGSGSSLKPELTGARLDPIIVNTVTLDGLLATMTLPRHPQLIKLDAQGAELDILAGAEHTMDRASFLQIELSLMRYNEDAPFLDEVVDFAAKKGFYAQDIFDPKYLPDRDLVQIDCLFGRERRAIPTR